MVYLSLVEKELPKSAVSFLGNFNFTKKEWTKMGSFAEDSSIIIKKADNALQS